MVHDAPCFAHVRSMQSCCFSVAFRLFLVRLVIHTSAFECRGNTQRGCLFLARVPSQRWSFHHPTSPAPRYRDELSCHVKGAVRRKSDVVSNVSSFSPRLSAATNAALATEQDVGPAVSPNDFQSSKDEIEDVDENIRRSTHVLLNEIPAGSLPSDTSWRLDSILPLMDHWAKRRSEKGARTCQALLERVLEERARAAPTTTTAVDTGALKAGPQESSLMTKLYTAYAQAIDAWAKSGAIESGDRAESLLLRMEEDGIRPNAITYNAVINSLAKQQRKQPKDHGPARRAEAILTRMESIVTGEEEKDDDFSSSLTLTRAGNDETAPTRPDVVSYNGAIEAYASAGLVGDAEKILERMLDAAKRDIGGAEPDRYAFNAVMNAWAAKSDDDPGAAERAEKVLLRMEEWSTRLGRVDLHPDTVNYTTVIAAFAKSKRPGSARRAEGLLERMAKMSKAGVTSVSPNTITVNAVIGAYAKHAREKGAAERAEKMLYRMEELQNRPGTQWNFVPDAVSFTSVIDCWAKSGAKEAPKRARRIFDKMQRAYHEGNAAAKPTVHSYNALINALVKSNKVDAAELVLQTMEGPGFVCPNVISYSTVMNGWAIRHRPERCEALLDKMEALHKSGSCPSAKPNAFSYSTAISAWVKSGKDGAIQRAEDVLYRMIERYRAGDSDAAPNKINFTAVIDGWSKIGKSDKARALLKEMESLYKEGSIDARPNQFTYNAVINSIAKGRQFGKAQKAQELLHRMVKLYKATGDSEIRPSVVTYTAVMNACAYTMGDSIEKRTALLTASQTYKELCASNYGSPNHVTYGTFLKACGSLIPTGDARNASLASVFRRCCEDGQVHSLVLRQLRAATDKEQFRKLLGSNAGHNGSFDMADLPAEWTRNLDEFAGKHKHSDIFAHR